MLPSISEPQGPILNDGNTDLSAALGRGHPLNSVIDNDCTRMRRELDSIEATNITLAVEFNNLFEQKCKLERELEIYYDRLKQLSLDMSRQSEIVSRLENLIMTLAPCLPPQEQVKLSNAVYQAKHFDLNHSQQITEQNVNCIDTKKPEPTAVHNGIDDCQLPTITQQQAIVSNVIQWLQSLVSQTDVDEIIGNVARETGQKCARKKPTTKRKPPASKKVNQENSINNVQLDPTLALASQPPCSQPLCSQPQASQTPNSQALKQTSMYDFFAKTS